MQSCVINNLANLWSILYSIFEALAYTRATILNALFVDNRYFQVFKSLLNSNFFFFDVARSWQIGFQKPGAMAMNSIIDLHHDIMLVMIFIVVFITYLLIRAVYLFGYDSSRTANRIKHYTVLEVIWTTIPAVILSGIALPSFSLLYSMDNVIDPKLTVKVIGHQWYWSYESAGTESQDNLFRFNALYKNFVQIAKFYDETLLNPIKSVKLTEVSASVFLQELLLRDLTCGCRDIEPYLNFFSELKKYYEVYNNNDVALNELSLKPSEPVVDDNLVNKRLHTATETCRVCSDGDELYFVSKKKTSVDNLENVASTLSEFDVLDTNINSGIIEVNSLDAVYNEVDVVADANDITNVTSKADILIDADDKCVDCGECYEVDEYAGNLECVDNRYVTVDGLVVVSDINPTVDLTSITSVSSGSDVVDVVNFINLVDVVNIKINAPVLEMANAAFPDLDVAGKSIDKKMNTFCKMSPKITAEMVYERAEHKQLQYYFPIAQRYLINSETLVRLAHHVFFTDSQDLSDVSDILQADPLLLDSNFGKRLLDILDNTLISGTIDYFDYTRKLTKDVIFSGPLTEWKSTNTYNEYIYNEANNIIGKYEPYPGLHENDESIHFFTKSSDPCCGPFPFRCALTAPDLHPPRHNIQIRWSSETVPVYYIPNVTTDIKSSKITPFPTSVYSVSSMLTPEGYIDYGFDYDSCLVSDSILDKHRDKVRKGFNTPLKYKYTSYTIPKHKHASDLNYSGWFRLLDVDNRLVLPKETNIRFLITSADVIHSWAIPSLGIKLDACPGRLNEITTYIFREGVYYGQCSEICGLNHGFMPISVQVTTDVKYKEWFVSVANAEIYNRKLY